MYKCLAHAQDKSYGSCEIRRQQDDDDWSGPLFIYILIVVLVIPGIVMGYAYTRVALALYASIKKVKGMKNEKE